MAHFEKIGDWEKVGLLIGNLAKEMENARQVSLKRWGLKAEGLAKTHISTQDLGWERLDPKTIATKIRKGYSENILVATSTYFQSITSWVDKKEGAVMAGVKKTVRDAKGNVVADIAKTHEFGSTTANIPARPLWSPVFKETVEWFRNSDSTPAKIFAKNIKKYGV